MITTNLPQTYKVLLVEDSEEDMELYKRLLKKNSSEFQIDEASTAATATEKIESGSFDCCVVDYQLPDTKGMEFIRYLARQKIEAQPFSIIMVTGQGSEEVAVDALKEGVDDYLTKKSISDGFFARPVINAIHKARLSSQIKHYQKELERSNRELTEFAHIASHDLKSPLRRVISYIDIILDEATDRLNDEDKEILGRMMINSRRMQQLINDLLTFSLINAEEEKKEEINLNKMIDEIIEEMEPQIKECNAAIICDALPVIIASPTRMRQLFINLFSNAMKYRSESDPEIRIRGLENDKNYQFVVQDNGQGIPEDMKNDIFKDFKRLYSQEEIEGTGLGLSICRKIVEQHEGKIWVESEEGKGSSFYFTVARTN